MKTTVIADGGATKIHWAVITPGAPDPVERFTTPGFNATSAPDEVMDRSLAMAAPRIARADEISFYGAGCRPGRPVERVARALSAIAPGAVVEVDSDIRAAIRAVDPQGPAIVTILGTGANTVMTRGHEIVHRIPSTGYILGDEASGADLGRTLMGHYVGGRLPRELAASLVETTGLTPADVIERVYRGDTPAAFLASMAPFIAANIDHPFISSMVDDRFSAMVANSIARCPGHADTPCHFVGSIAAAFTPALTRALDATAPLGRIIPAPLGEIIASILAKA